MQAIKVVGKVKRSRRRADFLFNDGQYRARAELNELRYRRQNKHRGSWDSYDERFYRDIG